MDIDKDQLDGLMALKLVADLRSFSAAAKKLQISPAAISKMITGLEKRMGVTLLTRTTRTVNLSEAGAIFLKQVGPAIEQIIIAQKNARSFAKKPSGHLKISMPGIFYPFHISSFISNFLKTYPDIHLEISADDQASDIFDKGFDAGVRADDILAKDLVAFKLVGPIKYVTVASPNYLQMRGTPKHPKDLLNHNCIRHRFGSGENIYEKWEFQESNKEFSVSIHGNLILNDSFNIRHAALSGLGIIYTEYGNVREDVEKGRLKLVLEKYSTQSTGYYLYYPRIQHTSPALRAFIEHFKETYTKRSKS